MPPYSLLLNFDGEHRPQSLASIRTNYGAYVVIFGDQEKLSQALELMVLMRANEPFTGGGGMGVYELTADSIDDAVQQVLAVDPSLAAEVTFVGDDDTMFEDLMESLRRVAGRE